ncbi:hypothetical protein PIB30_054297 [Stylosanthes scabra]|uniref:Uncharacterized protein n=1 Tax=Stylosanthes scabra TaxID=79078 RepID=A0ABU6YJX7_9FABA|nr:hypothetical protein [Stylosanthes scabra]
MVEGGTRLRDGVIGRECTTSCNRGAEDGPVSKGNVKADLASVKRKDDVTTSSADEATALSRGGVCDDSATVKRKQTLARRSKLQRQSKPCTRPVRKRRRGRCFRRRKWTIMAVEDGTTMMRGDGCANFVDGREVLMKREASFRCHLQLTARPAPLLAAVLPWDS